MAVYSTTYIVEEIFKLYKSHDASNSVSAEPSYLDKMCHAGWFALQEGYNDEVVLATFLHDIGQLIPFYDESESIGSINIPDTAEAGATYLRSLGFSKQVCELVLSSSKIKRNLRYKHQAFYLPLSDSGKQNLLFLGRMRKPREQVNLEVEKSFELCLKILQWNEAAKIIKQPLPLANVLREKLSEHLA